MLIYIPVPLSLAMSSVSSPMTQQLPPYQYQQQQQHSSGPVSLGRNSTQSIMCAAPTQTQHHHQPHHQHHISVAHHQTSPMNGGAQFVGAATGFTNAPGGYSPVPRIHHCNTHSFLCSNPTFHQYQVNGGCMGHHNPYGAPFITTGHPSAAPLLPPPTSHPQMYTQPGVSLGQPTVQQIGPAGAQSANNQLPPSAHSIPHHHQHHHQLPHPQQHHQLVPPFPTHTHMHQIPPHTTAGTRAPGVEVLSRGLYRTPSQGHIIGRVRRGGNLPGMGANRRTGNNWRGNNVPPIPPPPPLPTSAAAAAAYPGILLHFLAMLSHPSLHQYNNVEPVVTPEAPDTENYEALLHLAERLGEAKPRGLIKTVIDQLPSYRYTGETCDTKQTTCVICMCDFEMRQMLRVLPCLHEFHTKCVDKWLKSNRTCPICRGDASDFIKETPMSE